MVTAVPVAVAAVGLATEVVGGPEMVVGSRSGGGGRVRRCVGSCRQIWKGVEGNGKLKLTKIYVV